MPDSKLNDNLSSDAETGDATPATDPNDVAAGSPGNKPDDAPAATGQTG